MKKHDSKNKFYVKYGEKQERKVFEKLIRDGFTKEDIEQLRAIGTCIGCDCVRECCQCAFSGSAHPTDDERYEHIKNALKHLGVEK